MIVDIILWAIMGVALLIVLFVLARKIPVVGAIDIDSQPGGRARSVKSAIIEQRLERKLSRGSEFIARYIKPSIIGLKDAFSRLVAATNELNKRYERRIKAKQNINGTENDTRVKIKQLIFEADEFIDDEKWSEAEQRLIEIVTLDSKNIEAYHRLGDIYLEQKNYNDAKETYEHLIKLNQSDDVAFSGLAHVAEAEGRLADAMDEYKHSINLNTSAAQHHLDLCKVFIKMDKLKEATRSCKEAVKIEPNNPKMLSALLDVYIKLKDSGQAKAILEKIREVNPDNQKLEELSKVVDNIK